MTGLEKVIYSKIVFPFLPKKKCDNFFNKLVEIPTEDRFKESKRMEIKTKENPHCFSF